MPPVDADTTTGPAPRSPWIGRSGGALLLLAGVLVALGLLLLTPELFPLAGSGGSGSSNASSNATVALGDAIGSATAGSATGLTVLALGLAVDGPGECLLYLQRCRRASQYVGCGALLTGRLLFAVPAFLLAGSVGSLAGSVGSLSVDRVFTIPLVQAVVVLVVAGFIAVLVGRALLADVRNPYRSPRRRRFDRWARGARYVAMALGLVMLALVLIGAYRLFESGALAGTPGADTGGIVWVADGLVVLAVSALLGGVADLFQALAFAENGPGVRAGRS